jgi:hypothetical protein
VKNILSFGHIEKNMNILAKGAWNWVQSLGLGYKVKKWRVFIRSSSLPWSLVC